MSPAWIRRRIWPPNTRHEKELRTYQVLYRRGGRNYKIETAGSFKRQADAKTRCEMVSGWLAQGLDPKIELAKLLEVQAPTRRGYTSWADALVTSRIDWDAKTKKAKRAHIKRLRRIFADRDPQTFTVSEQIEAVAELAKDLTPSSLGAYWTTHRQVLDFAGVDPNPAADKTVKLPKVVRHEPTPPTAAELLAMLDRMTIRMRRAAIVLEQTAMAIGELETLAWGDVDVAGRRFRLRRANVKRQIGARARWVQVPDWLMETIADTCPPEDRTETRHVFQGVSDDGLRSAMSRACRTAQIPVYSPHDLRHRRLSLWHGQGVPAKELAARAGHTDAHMTLNTYSHVMPLDEAPIETLKDLLVMTQ